MEKINKFFALLLAVTVLLASCGGNTEPDTDSEVGADGTQNNNPSGEAGVTAEVSDIGFEHAKEDLETTLTVTCTEGTPNAYKLENGTLTFSGIAQDSIYTITGNLDGNIVIDVGDERKFELVFQGTILQCAAEAPVTVLSGDKVTLTAKKDSENFIYDLREAVDSSLEGVHSGAVHAECDLQIGGKGSLTVESKNNNGIHTKDDLEVKNLSLTVTAVDNALKGNDSVSIESGNVVLISRAGDGIKTSNSDVSDKGNQRGNVSILGGMVNIFAACDGIDASHDVIVEGEAVLNVYTDKFSEYSEEVTAVTESAYYIRFSSKDYNYAVKFTNDAGESVWKIAEFDSSTQVSGGQHGGRPGKPGEQSAEYCFYKLEKPAGYTKMQLFIYSGSQTAGQESDYLAASEEMTVNESYDTLALSSNGGSLAMSWTNYSTARQPEGFPGGPGGGMGAPGGQGGASQKLDHSTKGIKAANEIRISGGSLFIKAYDDAIHANAGSVLENGNTSTGNVTVSGGSLTLYSNDDGVHADGSATVSGGNVKVTNSYEGIEGNTVAILGGDISIISRDDGINSTSTSGTGITVNDGRTYIYAGGDGIDSNSRDSYKGILFSGGKTVVISTSGGNSAIDCDRGYTFEGGYVLAVMPSGGMSGEAKHCQNFESVAQSMSLRLNSGEYLTIGDILTVKMPTSLNGLVIFIGDKNADVKTSSSSTANIDANGVCWH